MWLWITPCDHFPSAAPAPFLFPPLFSCHNRIVPNVSLFAGRFALVFLFSQNRFSPNISLLPEPLVCHLFSCFHIIAFVPTIHCCQNHDGSIQSPLQIICWPLSSSKRSLNNQMQLHLCLLFFTRSAFVSLIARTTFVSLIARTAFVPRNPRTAFVPSNPRTTFVASNPSTRHSELKSWS